MQSTKREDPIHAMAAEFVQGSLEVVEYDTVGKTLEHKRELPEGVDDAYGNDWCYREKIDDNADNAQAHAAEQNAKSGRNPDNVDETQLVLEFDVPKEVADSENPPWITGEEPLAKDFVRYQCLTYRKTAS